MIPPSYRLKITPRRRRKRTWESGTLFIKTSWTFTHAGCKPTLASKIAARSRGPLGSRDSSYIIITLEAKVPVLWHKWHGESLILLAKSWHIPGLCRHKDLKCQHALRVSLRLSRDSMTLQKWPSEEHQEDLHQCSEVERR